MARTRRFTRLGVVRAAAAPLWSRIEDWCQIAALIGATEWHDLALAVRCRMDRRARHAGALRPYVSRALSGARMSADGPSRGANCSPSGGSAAATSASLDLRFESVQQQSASCDDSHWPSIP